MTVIFVKKQQKSYSINLPKLTQEFNPRGELQLRLFKIINGIEHNIYLNRTNDVIRDVNNIYRELAVLEYKISLEQPYE